MTSSSHKCLGRVCGRGETLAVPVTLPQAQQQHGNHSQFDVAARVLLGLALVLTALVYLNTLRFHFVYDDLPQIVHNARVQSWHHAPSFFVEDVWSGVGVGQSSYYRPLFLMWLLMNYTLFGLNPAGWHLMSLLTHVGVTWVAFCVVRKVTGDARTAGMAALIFGLHTTHVESVAWISGITEPEMALFFLGALLLYLKGREAATKRWRYYAGSVLLFALAVWTKETAAMLPVMIFAHEYWTSSMAREGTSRLRTALTATLPFIGVDIIYAVVRAAALHGLGHPEGTPISVLLLTVPATLVFYAQHLLWPTGRSVFYDLPLRTTIGWRSVVVPAAVMCAIVIGCVTLARRSRQAAFWLSWTAALLIPALVGIVTFVPEDLVHDRYLYLPSLGFAALAAMALRKITWGGGTLLGAPRLQVAAALIIALTLGAATASQNVYWASDIVLYRRGVEIAPRNVLAIDHLANEMYKRGQAEAAIELYRQSLAIKPDEWRTRFALGVTEFGAGKFAEAGDDLQRATELPVGNPDLHYFLGMALAKQGKFGEAERSLRSAIARYPRAPRLHGTLAEILVQRGDGEGARRELALEQGIQAANTNSR